MAEFDKAETVDDWQENVAEYVEESRERLYAPLN